MLSRFWNNKQARFITIGLVLYLLWDLVLVGTLVKHDVVRIDFTNLNRLHTQVLLQLISEQYLLIRETVYHGKDPLFRIVPACNAVNFMGHFLCFVLAFPLPIRSKTLFIPVGLSVIYMLNILRLTGLAFAAQFIPQYFNVIHSWIWPAIIYSIIIALCLFWITITEKFTSRHE